MDNRDNQASQDQIMTLAETALYLKLAEKTLLRMVHRLEIPCAKVGNQWRFVRAMVDDWLISRMQVVPRNDFGRLAEGNEEAVPLSRMIRPEYVVLGIKPDTKESVLAQLISPLQEKGIIKNRNAFLGGLLRRERLLSTAVGNGVALPHLRNPGENPIPGPAVIVGVCPKGTEYGSADGNKTYLFFILSTDSEVLHLRFMAKLTRLLLDNRLVEALKRADSADGVIAAFLKAEVKA